MLWYQKNIIKYKYIYQIYIDRSNTIIKSYSYVVTRNLHKHRPNPEPIKCHTSSSYKLQNKASHLQAKAFHQEPRFVRAR